MKSILEIYELDSAQNHRVYETQAHIEAPNWTQDGKFLIFNSLGLIYKIPVEGGIPVQIPTGFANNCNNDHVLSPDGNEIAISHNTQEQGSIIYILPIGGGTPRQITPMGPSYLHGWSPDGKTLSYCAQRNGIFDIYTMAVTGGPEKRLTFTPGLDDGPEYSSDGNYIYFNSERTGKMQAYRMKPDGSDQEQLSFDEYNNWFPHPSPDRKHLVLLSYLPEVKGHPANQQVMLRYMPYNGGEIATLVNLFGGQGTINVNSWSPDSKKIAFVRYEI